MKSLKILIVLFCLSFTHNGWSQELFAPKTEVNGYFITVQGDSLPIIFKLISLFHGEVPVLADFRDGFKYTDKNGKRGKITVLNTKEFGYTYNGKKAKFISVVEIYSPESEGIRDFRKLEIDGYLSLYSCTYSGQGATVVYTIKKQDAGILRWGIEFRDKICEYLKEDTELVRKIQNRELKRDDIEKIVQEYNRWYKYEHNTK